MTSLQVFSRRLLGPLALAALVGLVGTPDLFAEKKPNTAVTPAEKDPQRHKGFLDVVKKGDIDVVFFGDSITDGWRGSGKEVWKNTFEPMKAANFGIGGDRTEHVLWRIQHGELEGIEPKVVVLMIGTNNLGSNSAEEIADGNKAIVEEIQKKQPKAKILLLGIFPRSPKATDPQRDKIKNINKIIAKLDDGKNIKFLDIGEKFLGKDGELTKDIMPDYLHLSDKGYQIWADSTKAQLQDMLKQ
jgi:lysophospholipase L1-like esterase